LFEVPIASGMLVIVIDATCVPQCCGQTSGLCSSVYLKQICLVIPVKWVAVAVTWVFSSLQTFMVNGCGCVVLQ